MPTLVRKKYGARLSSKLESDEMRPLIQPSLRSKTWGKTLSTLFMEFSPRSSSILEVSLKPTSATLWNFNALGWAQNCYHII